MSYSYVISSIERSLNLDSMKFRSTNVCLWKSTRTDLHSKYGFSSKGANQTGNISSLLVHCLKQYPGNNRIVMAELKIASMNVRGIGNNNKRRETFNWLRNKQQSIIFLQEVHCTEAIIDKWKSEWGYKALFSCFSGNSAGVCILFNNNFKFDILKTFSDPSGRYIVCDIRTDEKLFTLANIYAPNEDDPTFFKQVFDHLHDFVCEEIILGGDFNLVLDFKEDKKGGLPRTYQTALKIIQQNCEELNLIDIWRTMNADKHRYTWRRKKPEIQCRLDFFLISSDLICDINLADIVPGYKTDHSMILLKIALHHNPRGRGFWKLNTSLLKEEEYLNLIKTTIYKTKNEYQSDNSVNPALLWDMIKMKVREKSIAFATAKNYKTKSREDTLYKEISGLEKELDENTALNDTQKSLLQSKLDNLRREMKKLLSIAQREPFYGRKLDGTMKEKKTQNIF